MGTETTSAADASKLFALRQEIDLDKEGYGKKRYVYRQSGEVMRLRVVPNDPRGNTHKAKSQNLFWEGDEESFRLQFDPTNEADTPATSPTETIDAKAAQAEADALKAKEDADKAKAAEDAAKAADAEKKGGKK